jgi:hypothetical protein
LAVSNQLSAVSKKYTFLAESWEGMGDMAGFGKGSAQNALGG